jgi:hydroxymethylglutaryl-CoA lyase
MRYHYMDVTMRDGLQSATWTLTLDEKKSLIAKLLATPIPYLEIGSLCNESRVPQMRGSEELFQHFRDQGHADRLFLFVPNDRGLERAFRAGLRNYSFLLSPDEAFLRENVGMTVYQSLAFVERACKSSNVRRKKVYISCVTRHPEATFDLIIFCMVHRVEHIYLSDTQGNMTPRFLQNLLARVPRRLLGTAIGLHLHKRSDEEAQRIIEVAQGFGITQYDISFLVGHGGCPFIPEEDRHENLHILDLETHPDFDLSSPEGITIQQAMEAFAPWNHSTHKKDTGT